MKTFLIQHNILEADRYVFPGWSNKNFLNPEAWPQSIKEILAYAEVQCEKHSMILLKGGVDKQKDLTQILVKAESADSIKTLYKEMEPALKKQGEEITFLKINECIDCEDEIKNEIQSIKVILNAA